MATIASAVRRAERVRVLRSTVCEPDEFGDPKIVLNLKTKDGLRTPPCPISAFSQVIFWAASRKCSAFQTNLRSRNLHPGCPGLSPVSGSPRAPIHGERLPKPTTRPRVVSPLRVASVVFHPCRPPAAAEDRRPFDARPRRRPGRRAARARGAHLERADVLAHLALRIHLDHELEVPYRRV